jgi:hypothetical protein
MYGAFSSLANFSGTGYLNETQSNTRYSNTSTADARYINMSISDGRYVNISLGDSRYLNLTGGTLTGIVKTSSQNVTCLNTDCSHNITVTGGRSYWW